ncbi:MAG TPA: CHRD domain-containing protein, partial [Xanthobacteraceae bacterium]|nr:CHRD domain-containing protein [Xanthobacteraceae bacterium]
IKGEATLTPEQAQQLSAGELYINVHTAAHPGGEIRGQVMPPKS